METKREKPAYGMWSNTRFMLAHARRIYYGVLILAAAQVILGVAMNLLELYVTPSVLKMIESAASLRELAATILFFALGLIFVGAASAYLDENTLPGRVSLRIPLISDIHDKFSKTALSNTQDQGFLKRMKAASKTVSSNHQATEAIWKTLVELSKDSICFVIYLILLTSLDPFLIFVTLATAAGGYFAAKRINSWSYRHREEKAAFERKMDYVGSKAVDRKLAKDIRIFGMRGWLEDIYEKTLRLYQAFCTKREKVYLWADIIDVALALVRNGIAYAYLISLALKTGMSASQFVLYFAAVGGFTNWVTGILTQLSTLHRQSLDLSTLREFLDSDEPFRFEDGVPLEPDIRKPYAIELGGVSYRYPKAEKDALHNVSLRIEPGEKLAVVGLNGAGKTTLIKLICGYLDPTAGTVRLNGQDIRPYNRRDYYRHFAAVFQKFSLLAATVAENIAQTDTDIDMEKVRVCANKAGLAEKIEALPKGYDTLLDKSVFYDAVELSGGEMQKLMLARALYKDAPIIVLDEPTAALDPIAESEVYTKYSEMTEGRTAVFISHRLASTRFCDRILLLEDGAVAEEGTHDELLRKGGRYAALFNIQSRYYSESEVCACGK